MGRTTKGILVAAATTAGAVVTTRLMDRAKEQDSGRHAITVYRPLDEIKIDDIEPLSALGDDVRVELRAAPGDHGTEIHAVRNGGAEISAGRIRRALREARSLLEVGEVLQPDAPGTTKPTVLNKPLRAITRRGREGGLL